MTSTEIHAQVEGRTDRAPKHRWWSLAVIGLAQLMVVLDATIVTIALPSAQQALHFDDGGRQWIVTGYSLAFGSLLLLGGRLSDLVGRKTMFIIGVIGFAGASALGGAAQNFTWLVVARVAQGACGALLAPAALSLLTTTFTDARERARAFGIYGAIAGSGAAIGLMLGGVLTEYLDWRWTLYVNDVFAVVALAGAIVVLGPSAPAGRARLDVPGVLLVGGGLFCVVFGFSNSETHAWSDGRTWGLLVAGALLLVAFVGWQGRAQHPLLPLRIPGDRNRGAGLVTVLVSTAGMFGVFVFLTYYLQGTLGYSPLQNGLAYLPMVGVLMVTSQLSTNWLVPAFGPKRVVPAGMLLGAAGMAWLTRLGVYSGYATEILPPLLVLGAGLGLAMPAAMSEATLGVAPADQGVASAAANTSQQVGGAIGTALLNSLVTTAAVGYTRLHGSDPLVAVDAALHGYATAYRWSACFFAVGALLTALLFRRRPGVRPAVVAEGAGRAAPVGVHGRVLDDVGAPVPRAVVTVLDGAGGRLAQATTGDDGRFALGTPASRSVVLVGSAPRHQPLIATVAVGSEPVAVDVVLAADAGVLIGTVRDTEGSAVAGGLVVAIDERGGVAGSTVADPAGYRIEGLVPGYYKVAVQAAGHRPSAEPAVVSSGVNRHDVELIRAAGLDGTVRGRDGRPLEGATVTLLDDAGRVVAARSTGANGTYSFTDLSGEQYTLVALGHPPVAVPMVLDRNGHDHLDIILGLGEVAAPVPVAATSPPG
jgi:EmrB/QacA subfamily drug resistance transporter